MQETMDGNGEQRTKHAPVGLPLRLSSLLVGKQTMPLDWDGDRQRVRARARRRMGLWAVASMCMVSLALYGKVLQHGQVCGICVMLGLCKLCGGTNVWPSQTTKGPCMRVNLRSDLAE